MDRRTRLASGAAVIATLLTGGAAAAALVGTLNVVGTEGTGQVQLVDDAIPASTPGASTSERAPGAGTTAAELAAHQAATPTGSKGAPAAAAAVPLASDHVSAPRVDQPGETPSTTPAPLPSTPPVPETTPLPTNAPPTNCSGSDDGMTEAQKQAREAACHGMGDD